MKEYQFKYTKMNETLLVIVGCILTCIILIAVGTYFRLQEIITVVFALLAAILLFRILRKTAVHNCSVKLSETSVEFHFEKDSRIIKFSDLISFKAYYGQNGPILYLKNNVDNFKIAANNNFCKTDDFRIFCEEALIQLDKQKKSTANLIHEGSIFIKRGMLYFLIFATLIYFLSLFFVNKQLKIIIGFCGGLNFLGMWIKYYIENQKTQDKNGN